jgi:hypothetical protein
VVKSTGRAFAFQSMCRRDVTMASMQRSENGKEMRSLSAEELDVVSGGSMASAANKGLKTVAMASGVLVAAILYLSLPECE